MSDPLDTVRNLSPQVGAQPELLERVRNDFMANIIQSPEAAPPRRSRRRWAIPIAAAAVLTTAATAWAVMHDSSNSTAFQCPDNAIIDAVTGDPVLDCANEWRRDNETEPPPMVAYDNGRGVVVVLRKATPCPTSTRPSTPGRSRRRR